MDVTVTPEVIRVDATPKDAEGKAIGPPQIFEGATHQEVLDKMAEAQRNASAKIMELRGKIKPDAAPALQTFTAKTLTADELFKIQQDMQDPTKMRDAQRQLIEAELGAPITEVRESLASSRELKNIEQGKIESQKFLDAHAEYYACPENQGAIQKFMEGEDGKPLAWTKKNLEIAYETVRDKLVAKPAATPAVEAITPTTRPRAATTALFSQHSSASGPAKPSLDAFAQEVAKMPSQEYRRRLMSEPGFAQKVNDLAKATR